MNTPTSTPAPTETCAYCGAPLAAGSTHPAPNRAGKHAAYCCYGCRVLGESGEKPITDSAAAPTPWFKVGVGAAIAGQAMLLGLAVNLAHPAGTARALLHLVLILSAVAVSAILGGPLARSAWDSSRARQVSIDFLFLAGIIGAFLASLVSTLTGQGAIYYEVVAVLLAVYTAGKTLGAQSRARALAEARQLRRAFETCRRFFPDGRTETVPVAEVEKGDRVLVGAGDAVSIDGQIERGEAFVTETPLTGEPFPVVRRAGDRVFAGSFSEDGELVVRATANGRDRRLDSMLAQVERAREKPTLLQAQADRVVRWFLPLVLLAALGTFVGWTLRADWTAGLFNAMAVLLVACPCAMGLATPIALWNALAVLASRGFVARSGNLVESLAGVTHVAFDKTGTLSEEHATLMDFVTLGDARQRRELLEIVRAVQARSRHPVARAFASLNVGERAGVFVRSVKIVPARGVAAWVELPRGSEHHLRIGQRDLVSDFENEPALLRALRHASSDALVYVEIDGQLVALASVRERLRDSATAALQELDALGVRWSVLTGDQDGRAADLGLINTQGRLTPEAKAARLRQLRETGARVAFVGDGVNDAPAMHAADVGIALEHGAGLTTASADAVLYGGNLHQVPWAITLCRQVRDAIRSNLLFAAAYNLIGVTLAAGGMLHPVVSALLMVTSSAIVSWRALRVTRAAQTCCVVSAATVQKQTLGAGEKVGKWESERAGTTPAHLPTFSPAHLLRRQSPNTAYGLLLITQGFFSAWLGRLPASWSALVIALCAAGAWGIMRFHPRNAEARRYAAMAFAMLALGNWGMLLGWWADLGFGRVSPEAACACHQLHASAAAGLLRMPWMNTGMVVFGLPPMLWGAYPGYRRWLRWSLGALSALGMILGMAGGSYVAARFAAPDPAVNFLLSFAGMTVGMLVGMFFCCELGRAVVQAFHRGLKR